MVKTCIKCKEEKPLSAYYKHPRSCDGHMGKCKECCKRDATNNRNANVDRVREYDRARGNRQPKGYLKAYRAKFPNKYKAVNMVNNSMRGGKLFKEPCEVCGTEQNIHAHHDDYSKPLNVRWLCAVHHGQWHTANGEGLNP